VFSYLRHYGVKYMFVKMTHEQDNLFLKTPLWNIGALNCKSKNLCFIDADVHFINHNWLKNIDDAF